MEQRLEHHIPTGILAYPPGSVPWTVPPPEAPPEKVYLNRNYALKPFKENEIHESNFRYSIVEQKYFTTEDGKVKAYKPPEDKSATLDEEANQNNPNKFLVTSYDAFFGTHINETDRIHSWIRFEESWQQHHIPVSPFSYGCWRIQVWKQFIPPPDLHIVEVSKRIPYLVKYPHIRQWFVENARGALPWPESELTKGWCKLCGCHVFGYPVDRHPHTECPFFAMEPMEILLFMSVNHPSHCGNCGTRTATHETCRFQTDPRTCDSCKKIGHTAAQKLCHMPTSDGNHSRPLTPAEQAILVQELRYKYYSRIKRLVQEGRLEYFTPHDQPPHFYMARNRDVPLQGWGTFKDPKGEFDVPKDHWKNYPSRILYRGLASPELDAAKTNHIPVFEPEDMDRIEEIADKIDLIRFGKIPTDRPGRHIVHVLRRQKGVRQALRDKLKQQREQDELVRNDGFQPETSEGKEEDREELDHSRSKPSSPAGELQKWKGSPLFPNESASSTESVSTSSSTESARELVPFKAYKTRRESQWFLSRFETEIPADTEENSEEEFQNRVKKTKAEGRDQTAEMLQAGEAPLSERRGSLWLRIHTIAGYFMEGRDSCYQFKLESQTEWQQRAYYLTGVSTFLGNAKKINPHFKAKSTKKYEETIKNEGFILYVPTTELFKEKGGADFWLTISEENWKKHWKWLQKYQPTNSN